MPLFAYECAACKAEEEHIEKHSDPPKKKCSSCGRRQLKRVIRGTNFQLKGGGWYADGYASKRKTP